MEYSVAEAGGTKVVEGAPGERLMARASDVALLIEACMSERTGAALLYAPNLPDGFFDLSTGQAGEILQKLRNYHIRLAVVRPEGSPPLSSRFDELMVEERRERKFGLFETREEALAWLAG